MSTLRLPVECATCTEVMTQPFEPAMLRFRYRASAPLLRVLEHDAIGHVLSSGWLAGFLQINIREEGSELFGLHPGVVFSRDGQDLGEADVFMLFADGRCAIAEYKRTAAGLVPAETDKLKRLANDLDASWTCLATLDWATNCGTAWQTAEQSLPDRPCFVLTGETLFSRPHLQIRSFPLLSGVPAREEVFMRFPVTEQSDTNSDLDPDAWLKVAWKNNEDRPNK
jgi:hypothetical protein